MKFLLALSCVFVAALSAPSDRDGYQHKAAVTSARLLAWTPKDGNADELGEWFEGDIMLEEGKDRPTPLLKNGLVDEKYRWTGGVVPFEIDAGVSASVRATIQQAMDIYKEVSCIRFVERTTETNYVYFTMEDAGCYSYVGMIGGRQQINYQDSSSGTCNRIGIVEHEMLHALGFHHMQSTYDRDEYVRINYENIQAGREHNFDMYSESTVSQFGSEYDYGSVMHYGRTAFSTNGQETITPLDPNAEIGQRDGLSDTDKAKLNAMYDGICAK